MTKHESKDSRSVKLKEKFNNIDSKFKELLNEVVDFGKEADIDRDELKLCLRHLTEVYIDTFVCLAPDEVFMED